jgi:hypothetical protein
MPLRHYRKDVPVRVGLRVRLKGWVYPLSGCPGKPGTVVQRRFNGRWGRIVGFIEERPGKVHLVQGVVQEVHHVVQVLHHVGHRLCPPMSRNVPGTPVDPPLGASMGSPVGNGFGTGVEPFSRVLETPDFLECFLITVSGQDRRLHHRGSPSPSRPTAQGEGIRQRETRPGSGRGEQGRTGGQEAFVIRILLEPLRHKDFSR